jgi:hypothetical protein
MSLSHSLAILDALMTVLDAEHAQAVVEHRRVTIKKPLTEYAAKLLAKKFASWGDANEAADIMIERAWQGFDSSWIRDRRRPNSILQAGMNLIGEMNGAASNRGGDGAAQFLPATVRH